MKQSPVTQADYVVVGGGSAGAIVARRLADSGAGVILVEAGKADRTRFVRKPGLIAVFHNVPQLKKKLDWGFSTVPQKHVLNRRIPQTRGKVLGGSSSINGMLFVRGNKKNFDDWALDGCKGWSWDDVLPAYKRMESWEGGLSDVRGVGGPVQVTRVRDVTDASQKFLAAMSSTAGVPVIDDYNGHEQEGVSVFQQSAAKGLRYSSSVSYLDRHGLGHLHVVSGALATKVVVENGRATGVEVRDATGTRVIRAHREVVLSAGAYQSPQLLQLSGIGPADHLRSVGIDVVADLPVGENLHDHMFVPLTFEMPSARNRSSAGYFARGVLQEYTRGSTWVGQTVFEVCGFVRTSLAADVPDLQIHALPWGYPGPNQDAPIRHEVAPAPALTVFSTLIYPRSRGTVRLASADPTAAPLIDPNFLAEPEDSQTLVEGIELIREAMRQPGIAGDVTFERSPGANPRADRTELLEEIKNRATTVYHPAGSCRMGSDERAVVDPELKVRGIDGLRVADASVMPTVTGGNTNAPAMMIGERCAELMLHA